jgi:hypothetical protein
MRLEFRADEGGFYTPDERMKIYCLLCGASGHGADGSKHYMTLQRGAENEDPDEDYGIRFEFDDQITGAYSNVRKCRLTRSSLEVILTHPKKKITEVAADISGLEDSVFEAMRAGLPRIFRGTKKLLQID